MKILFVTHRYPPRTGGVETHVHEIATRLVDRGHDVTVFSADAGSDVRSRDVDEGVHIRRFRSFSPGNAFHIAPQIVFAVRRTDADVVHAHNYHALPLFFAALGISDEKFVVTTHYHGESASSFRDALLPLYKLLGRWAVRQADDVVAVSEWEREQLQADFGVNATVIPNGLDVERFAEAAPEDRERPYLFCVGRIEEYKGIQHVVRALPELSESDLLIAGDGPYREELAAIARETGVEDRVEFLGYVDDDRLPGLYAGAEVLLNLSEFEAYGMTVAEALASGTPCIVRDEGGLTDWVEQRGVISLEATRPTSVGEAVSETVGHQPDRKALQTWSTVTGRLEVLYSD